MEFDDVISIKKMAEQWNEDPILTGKAARESGVDVMLIGTAKFYKKSDLPKINKRLKEIAGKKLQGAKRTGGAARTSVRLTAIEQKLDKIISIINTTNDFKTDFLDQQR